MFGIKKSKTDFLMSTYVRMLAGWKCERCQRDFYHHRDILDNSHFISRGNKVTRWDLDNTASLCRGCHLHFGHNPDEHVEFFRSKLGDKRFNALMARKNQTFKGLRMDEAIIRMGFEKAIEEMEKNVIGKR